jgi:hypothetical protein
MKSYLLLAVFMIPTAVFLGAAATSLARLDECVATVIELPREPQSHSLHEEAV